VREICAKVVHIMLVKLTIGKRDRGLAKIQTRNIKTGRLRQRVRHRLVGGRGRHLLRRWSVSFDRWEEEDEIGFESRLSKYLSSAGNNFTSFTLSQDCIFCSFGIPVLCIKCWWNQPLGRKKVASKILIKLTSRSVMAELLSEDWFTIWNGNRMWKSMI